MPVVYPESRYKIMDSVSAALPQNFEESSLQLCNRKKNNRHSYHEAFDRRDNRDSFKSRYNNEDYQGSFKGGNRDFRRGQRQGYEEVPRYNLRRDKRLLTDCAQKIEEILTF